MHSAIPIEKEMTFNPAPRCAMSNTRHTDNRTNPPKTRATPALLNFSERRSWLDSIPLRVINLRHSELRRLLLDLRAVADDHNLGVV